MDAFAQKGAHLLENLGLIAPGAAVRLTPLTGGVSSEIARADFAGRSVCVKFALAQLKVDAVWSAPVRRNLAEYRWLEFVSRIAPRNVPELYGYDAELGGFAMELISGNDIVNWKELLFCSAPVATQIAVMARLVGRIHARSVVDQAAGVDLAGFDNANDFFALRIDPYLLETARRNPGVAKAIEVVADELARTRIALVHGDVSPKNILLRSDEPVILDAECATMGDPAFDVAFFLNHLVLKAVHTPARAAGFASAARLFMAEYRPLVSWEDPDGLERRVAHLLPMLMLARVDGKSPVEYLDPPARGRVRQMALHHIRNPDDHIGPILDNLETTHS